VARKMTPSQYNAWVRQENARRQRAVDAYNAEVKRVNAHNQRVVNDHNRRVDAHNRKVVTEFNRRVRQHNERLRREISRLSASASTRHVAYRTSVSTLTQTFSRLESAAESGTWSASDELFDLSESETANSVGALNALLSEDARVPPRDDEITALRSTVISNELSRVSVDLDSRWRGALFSLHPDNPDASRHFCTSAREMMSALLEAVAPDASVIAANPGCDRTPQGSVSRRARIRYCLARNGEYDPALESFIEADMDNVVSLFAEFNSGTHGDAGRFDLGRLTAIKTRVEGAIQFVSRIGATG
jgi:hypothetical protein